MTRITKHLACAEVTVDMAGAMNLIAKKCFPKTEIVTDRFHVQKLASEAVQEVRIRLRWEIIDVENEAISTLKNTTTIYKTEILENGETKRQLLARSRFTLFKSQEKWTENQKERAVILFNLYPEIKKAYESIRFILSQALKSVFESKIGKDVARTKLALWYNKVEDENLKSFNTIKKTIQHHYKPILNYFNNRNTNASAESFNAKIKAFRAQFRGVRDVTFFLYRLTKIYA
ncbi:ISAon1 family transposase [Tenacibaculum finnmarkense]|uniref:ISAon1 family transposase n=1 Tax=Tenacibaculum finnmarkense TaxID=2781243 RepID=UPI001EFBF9A3|nr:transposase [Tenacibaculum finnmarkense]